MSKSKFRTRVIAWVGVHANPYEIIYGSLNLLLPKSKYLFSSIFTLIHISLCASVFTSDVRYSHSSIINKFNYPIANKRNSSGSGGIIWAVCPQMDRICHSNSLEYCNQCHFALASFPTRLLSVFWCILIRFGLNSTAGESTHGRIKFWSMHHIKTIVIFIQTQTATLIAMMNNNANELEILKRMFCHI